MDEVIQSKTHFYQAFVNYRFFNSFRKGILECDLWDTYIDHLSEQRREEQLKKNNIKSRS